jgi:hypothetical protein
LRALQGSRVQLLNDNPQTYPQLLWITGSRGRCAARDAPKIAPLRSPWIDKPRAFLRCVINLPQRDGLAKVRAPEPDH